MEQIHGHTIMHWLCDTAEGMSLDQLAQRVRAEFGEDARFKTCNSEGHTLAELISVLESRGKIVGDQNGYRALAHTMCANE